MNTGDRVKITPKDHWYKCIWFPERGQEVTGIVEKVFKNNRIAIAVDQIRRINHQHGRLTLHFDKEEVSSL